jgi:hypothetical protein
MTALVRLSRLVEDLEGNGLEAVRQAIDMGARIPIRYYLAMEQVAKQGGDIYVIVYPEYNSALLSVQYHDVSPSEADHLAELVSLPEMGFRRRIFFDGPVWSSPDISYDRSRSAR